MTYTSQDLHHLIHTIPEPSALVMDGVQWGDYAKLFTPAYWKLQYILFNIATDKQSSHRLGESLLEEVVCCLLGGYGFKAELGLAAFSRLKSGGLIKKGVRFGQICEPLMQPFEISHRRQVKYRFPAQKARFISDFLNMKDLDEAPHSDDIALRNWLLGIKGIGLKTASWITRNHLASQNVAIIDIHIFRACRIMGLFHEELTINRDYLQMEQLFLRFCQSIAVLPSKMDALMWSQMKLSGTLAINAYNQKILE